MMSKFIDKSKHPDLGSEVLGPSWQDRIVRLETAYKNLQQNRVDEMKQIAQSVIQSH